MSGTEGRHGRERGGELPRGLIPMHPGPFSVSSLVRRSPCFAQAVRLIFLAAAKWSTWRVGSLWLPVLLFPCLASFWPPGTDHAWEVPLCAMPALLDLARLFPGTAGLGEAVCPEALVPVGLTGVTPLQAVTPAQSASPQGPGPRDNPPPLLEGRGPRAPEL